MTLLELYNLKLAEYKETGLKERPWKLLAMLLLSDKDKYEPLRSSQGEFYRKYKTQIDKAISKVEKDFDISEDEIIDYIEKEVICDKYEYQKIWFVYVKGFSVLDWSLMYRELKTPEEIYVEFFDTDELTTEERIFILKQLENKCCMNCANESCRVEYSEKIGVDEFGKPQGSECVGWFNAELIGRSRVLRKNDINKLK